MSTETVSSSGVYNNWLSSAAEKSDNQRLNTDPPPGHIDPVARPLPQMTLRRYADRAVEGATFELLESGRVFAEIPGFGGAWAEAATVEGARRELEEVVFEWAILKFVDGDEDLPSLPGLDLNKFRATAS